VNVTGTTTVTPGVWHHAVVTADGHALSLYLDGFLEASTATTITPGDGSLPLRLGARGDDANNRLHGTLDEVAIYPEALTGAQVAAHYLAGAHP